MGEGVEQRETDEVFLQKQYFGAAVFRCGRRGFVLVGVQKYARGKNAAKNYT